MVKRKSAFTLIELLVVISIIAILAGLLMPTLAKARGMAYMAKCGANMKSLGAAFLLYSNDHGMYLPSAQCWQEALAPYLDLKEDQFRVVDLIARDNPGFIDQSELNKRCQRGGATDEDEIKDFQFLEQKTPFRCPSDYPGDKYGTEVAVNSYGINAEAAMNNGNWDYQGRKFFPSLEKVRSVQRSILLMEVAWSDQEEQDNNLGTTITELGGGWIPPATVWADSPGWHRNQNPWVVPGKGDPDLPCVAWRHNEKAHACFMDGHVELLSPRQTVGMAGSNLPLPGHPTPINPDAGSVPGAVQGYLRGLDAIGTDAWSKGKEGQWFKEHDWPDETDPQ